jgi:hypothetical protein
VAKEKKKSEATDPFLGDKIRAGTLLSSYLRRIAQEQTELVADPDRGDRMGTKAEALARLMFKMALGYAEEVIENGKVVVNAVRPDRGMIALIWDRIEGRAPLSGDPDAKKHTIADRVSEQSKVRLNKLAANGSPDPNI